MTDGARTNLRGAVDLLILRTLSWEPTHGWGISQQIQERSEGVLEMNQGSLYPALQRLEQKGWIDSEWHVTDQNRRAKVYALTPRGRRELEHEAASWRRHTRAVEMVLSGGTA